MKLARELAWAAAAILLAFLIGGILTAFFGHDPVEAYRMLLLGAFGTGFDVATTFAAALPLVFTGLSVAVAFQCGLFNIGASGQFWLGGIAAAWIGYSVQLPAFLHCLLALSGAAAAGALWALAIPGLTKAYRGANEVITTLMMTYIAVELGHFLLEKGPMQGPGFSPESPKILASAVLPKLAPGTQLSWGVWFAPLAAILVWLLLYRTTLGFTLRMTGANLSAARYAGANPALAIIAALGISGAVSGFAGGMQILGVDHRLYDSFDLGYGFTGIVVALLGRNHPFGVLPAALLFGALDNGANSMQIFAEVPANLADVIKGIIIIFIAAEGLSRYFRVPGFRD